MTYILLFVVGAFAGYLAGALFPLSFLRDKID